MISEQYYKAVICTCRQDNAAERHILAKNGWKNVWNFRNKSGDVVELWARTL